MGNCMVDNYIEKTFTIVNKCDHRLEYKIKQIDFSKFNLLDENIFLISPNESYIEKLAEKEIKIRF